MAALLPALAARASSGDRVCAVAMALLSGANGVPPHALAAALDRAVVLIDRQDAQIRRLLDMVESRS